MTHSKLKQTRVSRRGKRFLGLRGCHLDCQSGVNVLKGHLLLFWGHQVELGWAWTEPEVEPRMDQERPRAETGLAGHYRAVLEGVVQQVVVALEQDPETVA